MDNGTDDYGWQGTAAPSSASYIDPCILRLVKANQGRKVLDLGSGNGALCASLARAGLEPTGLEADRKGYEISCASHPGIRFHNMSIYDDPAPLINAAGLFDVVVSTEVIEHLYSPHRLPEFARSCLNKDGLLILSTPYHGYLKNLALSLFNKWDDHLTPLWHGGHIKFWSRGTLTRLLEDAGFQVVGFHGVGRVPWLWKSMILTARVR